MRCTHCNSVGVEKVRHWRSEWNVLEFLISTTPDDWHWGSQFDHQRLTSLRDEMQLLFCKVRAAGNRKLLNTAAAFVFYISPHDFKFRFSYFLWLYCLLILDSRLSGGEGRKGLMKKGLWMKTVLWSTAQSRLLTLTLSDLIVSKEATRWEKMEWAVFELKKSLSLSEPWKKKSLSCFHLYLWPLKRMRRCNSDSRQCGVTWQFVPLMKEHSVWEKPKSVMFVF